MGLILSFAAQMVEQLMHLTRLSQGKQDVSSNFTARLSIIIISFLFLTVVE